MCFQSGTFDITQLWHGNEGDKIRYLSITNQLNGIFSKNDEQFRIKTFGSIWFREAYYMCNAKLKVDNDSLLMTKKKKWFFFSRIAYKKLIFKMLRDIQ